MRGLVLGLVQRLKAALLRRIRRRHCPIAGRRSRRRRLGRIRRAVAEEEAAFSSWPWLVV